MKVRRISLRNFGGVEASDVTFPPEGVTIVEGDNEAGKSTLLLALDAIVEFADNSTSRRIKDLVPVGKDVGPEVEVELETGPYAFTYRKRWVRDRETVLEVTRPIHEQLTGRDAHDRVDEILRETLDKDLWRALRLDQGAALKQASFGATTLSRALDAAVGGDIAGEREDALWDRIEAENSRYWTKTGRPRDAYARALAEYEDARAAVEDAREHLRSLDEMSTEVEKLASQADKLARAAAEAEDARKGLERRLQEVAEVRNRRLAAVAAHDRAVATHAAAATERTRREEQVQRLDAATDELNKIIAEVDDAEPEHDVLAGDAARAGEEAARLRTAWEEARLVYERSRQDADLLRWKIEVSQLRERVRRVEEARRDATEAEETIEAISVDGETLAAIEAGYLQVVELRAAVDRALPEVQVEALKDLVIVIDGNDVALTRDETHDVSMHGSTELVIPDIARVVVTAGTEGADIVGELQEAESEFAALCERAGVSGVEDARTQADRKADAERSSKAARETIERDLADLSFEELTHKLKSLSSRIETYRQQYGDESRLPGDHTEAQEAEAKAKQALDAARIAFEAAEKTAGVAKERLDVLRNAAAGRAGKLEIARNAVASARSLLDAARAEHEDDAIYAAAEEAADAVAAAKRAIADCDMQLRDLDAETLDTLVANAQELTKRRREELAAVVQRKKERTLKLTFETERGPAKLLDEAETRLVEAERRYESLDRRAKSAAVLRDTFNKHRATAHRRYIQPFRNEIERLGRIVFGSTFAVSMNEDLSIETRTLEGETLAFSQLSTGAQEQLGVLSRLACARLVSDEGGVPVVLDDALGWTDPERLDLMGAAISSAADTCQVIILTCVPDRYAAVGKARTVRI